MYGPEHLQLWTGPAPRLCYITNVSRQLWKEFVQYRGAGARGSRTPETPYVLPGIQIMQILPWHLQLRARLFPRLPSTSQVYPGFFDAPGCNTALLPPSIKAQLPPAMVTIAFCTADKYDVWFLHAR